MNELAIDVREEILEECRGAAELADALIQDYARTSIVRELALTRRMKFKKYAFPRWNVK